MAQRVISASVAIVLAVFVLFFNHTIIFPLAISLISALIIFELFRATKSNENKLLMYTALVFTFLHPFVFQYFSEYLNIYYIVFALASFLIFIKTYSWFKFDRYFFSMAFSILVTLSMSTLIALNVNYKLIYVVVVLCCAWIADTGAYFTGSLIGKHKLSPKISPKKSIEGFIGGILVESIVLELLYIFVINSDGDIYKNIMFFVVALLAGAIGTLGDLSASVIKRQNDIKDFGNIMPGHGGALDRFDSVLMVAPFFYVCINTFNL